MKEEVKNSAISGGEFIIRSVKPEEIFIREEWNEEQNMIEQTCKDFIDQEITPLLPRTERMEPGLMPSLLDKAGELGLLGISVPEAYGGMGMDFKTSMLCTEVLGEGHSFSVAYGAHSGIGTLPLLYYGSEAQKQKYLPKLVTGEWKASYCLTEPSSGSDANSAKSKAVLSADGKHYILNGQKMWITNAGFAHVFTVFARIDDDENLSAFILTKDMEGITLNPEEHKMGIKGSSTRQIFFNDVKVPVENLLYERNQGFKIAVNILNIGRIKLAAGVLGAAKAALKESVQYAIDRQQFGRSISKYGAIKQKLADMTVLTFALDSATYRATQNIEDAINSYVHQGLDKGEATLKGIASFAPECALLKVFGSETLDFVVDEGVQIHGGMGISAETRIEMAYLDSRVNRIFEGTNEINRMLLVDMILKKALKGQLDLMGPALKVADELMSIPDFGGDATDLFERHEKYVTNMKKAVLMVAGAAVQKLSEKLSKEQEILMNIADMIMLSYMAESTLLRTQKIAGIKGAENAQDQIAMMQIFISDSADKIAQAGKDALWSFAEGDELKMMLMGLKRFTKITPFNLRDAKRKVADKVIDQARYPF